MSNWFYADASQQRRGPVSTEQLRTAYEQGQVTSTSLVWCEGMPTWLPLFNVANRLEISLPPGPPPMPFTAGPNYAQANAHGVVLVKSSGGSYGWIIAVVVVFGGISVLSILAAIAIPAYQDFLRRARVTQVITDASEVRAAVDTFYDAQQRCPESQELEFAPVLAESADLLKSRAATSNPDGRCRLQYVLSAAAVGPGFGQNTLTFLRETEGAWGFETTLQRKFLPASMREGNVD